MLNAASLACYIHVDDGLLFSSGSSAGGVSGAETAMQEAADDLEELGFTVKDRLAGSKLEKIVDYDL